MDNFERLPAHNATGGLEVVSVTGDSGLADGSTTGDGSDKPGGVDAAGDGGLGKEVEAGDKVEEGEDGKLAEDGQERQQVEQQEKQQEPEQQTIQRKRRDPRAIPAKFLQAISAGLSTDLDPKVKLTCGRAFCCCCWLLRSRKI